MQLPIKVKLHIIIRIYLLYNSLQTIGLEAFHTCESNSSVAETATGASIDPSTAEVTRLQSLVSAKDTENEQLRAEIERLRALLPTTTDAATAVPTPCASVEAIVSTYSTSTLDNLASARSSQSMPSVIASDAISQYLDSRQRVKDRILSAWTAAGLDK